MRHDEKFFKREAQHHVVKAAHHAKMAAAIHKCMGKTAKAKSDLHDLDVESLTELLQTFIDQHEAMNDEHGEMAECAASCAQAAAEAADEAAEKAAQLRLSKRSGDGAAIQPGQRLPAPPPGCVAVPRGAKTLTTSAAPEVAVEFQKMFSASE